MPAYARPRLRIELERLRVACESRFVLTGCLKLLCPNVLVRRLDRRGGKGLRVLDLTRVRRRVAKLAADLRRKAADSVENVLLAAGGGVPRHAAA